MSQNPSKNHHYIPRSVVKQFCYEGESLLLFDSAAPEKGYRQRNVEKAFQKFHGNTITYATGSKSDHVERWLAENIDNPLGKILSDAAGNPGILLEPRCKRILAKYLITLLFRAPRGRDYFMADADPIATAMELVFRFARTLGVEDSIDIFGKGTPADVRGALPIILPTMVGDEYLDVLMNCEFAIAQPPDYSVFCLGDFPMMRYDDPRNAQDGLMHEYWFILGPRLAACFLAKSTLKIEGTLFRLPKSYIQRINFDFAMRSQLVAANCPVALHQTVRHLGTFPEGRNLAETSPTMFEPGGQFCS